MKKSIKAGLVSAAVAASLILSSIAALAFSDTAGHWAEADIDMLSGMRYISGYVDNTFQPDEFITRAEFVTIVNKIWNVTETDSKTFTDVSTDAWYADEINKAFLAGFITGYVDGTVHPDACISREEAAVICYKAWSLTPEGYASFTDSDQIGSWSRTQITTLVSKNVLSGYEDGSFRPNDAITRAEVAKIMSRLIDLSYNIRAISGLTEQQAIGLGIMPQAVLVKTDGRGSGLLSTQSPVAAATAAPTADVTASPETDATASPETDATSSPAADATSAPEADATASPEADATTAPTVDVTAPTNG